MSEMEEKSKSSYSIEYESDEENAEEQVSEGWTTRNLTTATSTIPITAYIGSANTKSAKSSLTVAEDTLGINISGKSLCVVINHSLSSYLVKNY